MSDAILISSKSTTVVERRRLGAYDWLIASQSLCVPLLSSLERPELLLRSTAEQLKPVNMPGREVLRVRLGDNPDLDFVMKHFIPRGWAQSLKWSWRESRAFRAFHMARQIAALGFLTPTPVAAGERRQWGVLRESFLFTRFIPQATPLHLINARCADRRRRLGIVRGLAERYAALHDAGFFHRDPSQANFLAVPQPDGSDTIAIIDLDGLHQRGRMSFTDCAEDLRRLLQRAFLPRRERAWFIVTYSRARKRRVNIRLLLTLIGPLPAKPTFPHCALDDHSQPIRKA